VFVEPRPIIHEPIVDANIGWGYLFMGRQPPTRQSQVEPSADYALENRFVELTAQFDLLRAQVRQAQQLASLGTAAAMLAHEVNNLLTPIRSYAEFALANQDVELMKKALTVTAKSVHILMGMSARVLEISAAKPRKPETVSVRKVIEDALASLCRELSRDGIGLTVEADPSISAWVDPLQLQQVLFNLLLNAREAMAAEHGGRLTISAHSSDTQAVITVSNTGPSIPAELLPHLFEPFQSSKPAERDGRTRCGGLGLALCKDLVEENDGTLGVTSDPGTLTTFTLRLPANFEAR